MKVLVVGSGGREHALAWALGRSIRRPELLIAPGNAGTVALGTNVPVAAADVDGLLRLAREQAVDLTVVGPEAPLVRGVVDRFRTAGMRVVGPTAAAARLEGSKAFAKAFMQRWGIPTAAHRTFALDAYDEALAYVDAEGAPIVVKASGLAAGKGAIVCETKAAARDALTTIMKERRFGQAGDEVVVEAFMQGEEASVFALADGTRYVLLASAQDHKRAGEGDTGPNTGGMGAYAPAPAVTPAIVERVRKEIIEPTLHGMAQEGMPYTGFLYCGLMLTETGPRVVEYNCRLGDPEAQVVLPLLETDLVDLFTRVTDGDLGSTTLTHRDGAAACVVLASGGYPASYEEGKPITGVDAAEDDPRVTVFHAGTARSEDGTLVTAGGRVMGVTAQGADLRSALDASYEAVGKIRFDGMQYRGDVGWKGLQRLDRQT